MLWEFLSRIRRKLNNDHVVVELLLIGSALGLAAMLAAINGNKVVVLNLFYLPVVLGGFFLGRYRAGIMALLCVIAASLARSESEASARVRVAKAAAAQVDDGGEVLTLLQRRGSDAMIFERSRDRAIQ